MSRSSAPRSASSQRQSLRAAHVGAIGVDAAGALGIEERAGADWVRCAVREQRLIIGADALGFDCEHRDAVEAAAAAAALALQARAVQRCELACARIHLGV